MSADQLGNLSVLCSRDGVKVRIAPASAEPVATLLSPDQALEMARALVMAADHTRRMIAGPDVVGHG